MNTVAKKNSERFSALKYKDFRLLWFGQLVSSAGSQMQLVAVNWQIYILTGSALALGLIGLARVIPIIIFSLIGGSIADVFNRKKVLLASQIFLAIFSGILAITTFTHTASPLIIYLLTIVAAVAISFNTPAQQAFVPSLVKREHLANALSLNVILRQISTIAGPAVAGFLIAKFGVGSIYAFDAVSFLAVIGSLLAMRASGEVEGKTEASKVSFKAILEGLVFVKSHVMIWSTMILDFFSTFFSSASALLPIFAKDILHIGPQGLGLLYASVSLGALVAGAVIANMKTLPKQGKLLLIAVGVYAVGTILFGFSRSFLLSLLALFIIGAGDSVSTVIRNTLRQILTPDHIRGRMTSVNMIFFMGGPQLGEFEAGLLASFAGAPLSVVIGGAATLLVVALVAVYIPKLRNYEGHEELIV
jgi:MFS family permease